MELTHEEYEKSKGHFWKVQSLVDHNTISNFTKTCKKDNCMISARQVGESTSISTYNHYNKDGYLINTDHNRYDVSIYCDTCGRHNLVKNSRE